MTQVYILPSGKYVSGGPHQCVLPATNVSEGEAIITIAVDEKHHHFAGGVHGSVYDEKNNEIGRGNGIFVRGELPLTDAWGDLSDEPDNRKASG